MTGLERWAAGRLSVYVVDARSSLRNQLCNLLTSARIAVNAYADAATALAAMHERAGAAHGPNVIIVGPAASHGWLQTTRRLHPGLVTIGLTPLIRLGDAGRFAPLRDLLGVDYLLSDPPDAAALLATLVLATEGMGTAQHDHREERRRA